MKNHFVLVELSEYDNYPGLVPIRDYHNVEGNTPTSIDLGNTLVNDRNYTRIESNDNIIYIPPEFNDRNNRRQ
jgi:hypothetical protein